MSAHVFPNTFIVGAPKCGTTAMSTYLGAHPSIFFSTPKEPSYLASEFPGIHFVTSMEDYEALFCRATDTHQIVAEGSVWYLYSTSALDTIAARKPDAKLILMLRNPVNFLESYFSHLRRSFTEDQPDFETAWNLQDERASGHAIPEGCRIPFALQYRLAASFGAALKRIMDRFPSNQIHVIFFDDFAADPAACYRDVLGFLGLEHDGRKDFSAKNIAGKSRSLAIARLTHQPPTWARTIWSSAKKLFGPSITRIPEMFMKANTSATAPEKFTAEMSQIIMAELADDVRLLSSLTQRDLTHWLNPLSDHHDKVTG